MANTSALVALSVGMQAYLESIGSTTVVSFGWRARAQILNQGPGQANRIVVVPGDPSSGAAGTFFRGRKTNTNPRVLLNWHKLGVLSLWAVDTTDVSNEAKQYSALEDLLELAVQAVHNAIDPDTDTNVGKGNITLGNPKWSIDNAEMYFGREMLIPLTQESPLYDQPIGTCTPQAAVNRDPITP